MNTKLVSFFLGMLALALCEAAAAVRYVNLANPTPAPPYADWTTAATNMQDAIDVANAGDEIVVTNGVYATGGRVGGYLDGGEPSRLTNRVAVTKPVTLRSVNGPEVTQIVGFQEPGYTNGESAVRCVYLTNGAALIGFTLTTGATREYLFLGGLNKDDKGGGVACESTNEIVSNCILTGNSGIYDGGAYRGTLNNCWLLKNQAGAGSYGGGAGMSVLNNCVLAGNAAGYGGGADGCNLNHCTVVGNAGGGVSGGTCNNCIIYYNTAGFSDGNVYGSELNHSCTTPLPNFGEGNISGDPQLASLSHLSATSPCRGRGSPDSTTGVDLDGEPWGDPPSIGCDEFMVSGRVGPIHVEVLAATTAIVMNVEQTLRAWIEGRASASRWDFGDGVIVSNRLSVQHAWLRPGDYEVVLTAYNESHPDGVSARVSVRVVEGIHYVWSDSPNPTAPYTSWTRAAHTIQDAVDAVELPASLVLVTNGVYETGGGLGAGMSNRVAVTLPIYLRSVNGPEVTVIVGHQVPGSTFGCDSVRCVYLTFGASMAGFTLTNGATAPQPFEAWGYENIVGGGAYASGASLSNCLVTSNAASSAGGGVFGGTLHHCLLTGNSARQGGGAAGGILNECTLTGNSASYGGGTTAGTLNNCLLTRNSAYSWGGGAADGTLNNCTLQDNHADGNGGGTAGSTLNRCVLTRNSAGNGGGAGWSTLNNCTITSNSAAFSGGGVWLGTLNNCTLAGNTASVGGGAAGEVWQQCLLNNCILYYNTATDSDENYNPLSTLNYSCTIPLPLGGEGDTDEEPQFIGINKGNLRLQPGSPCINTGNDAYTFGDFDQDGRPRIAKGSVDMGAYEFQGASMGEFIAWLQQFGLPTDGSVDNLDLDGDHFTNFQEWRAGTDPTDASSVLRLLTPTISGADVVLRWESVPGKSYFVERSGDFTLSAGFIPLARGISGEEGSTVYTDQNAATNSQRHFYRVGVQ